MTTLAESGHVVGDEEVVDVEVDYVIVDYRTPRLAEVARHSLEASDIDHSVTVVDSFAEGLSYGQAVNRALADGSAPIVCALNADVQCIDSQRPILDIFETHHDVAAVGPRQVDLRGMLRHAGIIGTNAHPQHRLWGYPIETFGEQCDEEILDVVTAAGSVYYARREIWEQLGGFLETRHYFEETWFSYLARHRGHRVVYTALTTWIHEWGASPTEDGWIQEVFVESQARFREACDLAGIEHD